MLHHSFVERVELFRLHGHVDCTPGYRVGCSLIANDELVLRRTAGAIGVSDQRAVGGELGFVAADGVFDEGCG